MYNYFIVVLWLTLLLLIWFWTWLLTLFKKPSCRVNMRRDKKNSQSVKLFRLDNDECRDGRRLCVRKHFVVIEEHQRGKLLKWPTTDLLTTLVVLTSYWLIFMHFGYSLHLTNHDGKILSNTCKNMRWKFTGTVK